MSKNIKIALIVFLAIILMVAAYFFIAFRSNPQTPPTQPQTPPQTQLPNPPSVSNFVVPPKDADKMTLDTTSGKIEVNNLYKNPVANLSGNGVALKENDNYSINFYPQDEGFIISLQNPDIQTARDKAEADFLQALGITKEQACSLKVTLGIPYYVSPTASGQNYGLSFCPNGMPLPK